MDECMNIGVDVDGVLADIVSYQLKYGKEYFGGKLHREIKNPKGYDICDIFDCTGEERDKFWIRYIWAYCLDEPMTKGAKEFAQMMHGQGHKIYVVTGRAHTTEQGMTGKIFRWMLKRWLCKNHFHYDDIFYCSETNSAADKYDVCIQNGIDVLIDDKAENLLALKDKVKIYCYPAVWNEDNRELDRYRISGFDDLMKKMSCL